MMITMEKQAVRGKIEGSTVPIWCCLTVGQVVSPELLPWLWDAALDCVSLPCCARAWLPVFPSTAELSGPSQCILLVQLISPFIAIGIVLQHRRRHVTEEELRRKVLLLCDSCPYWCAVDRQDPSLLAFTP